ncbi:MAG: hypothetical protein M3443_20655 [Actinomycetota bacterium]|nr:hypothetical protein [Actinomycetota bacterium]
MEKVDPLGLPLPPWSDGELQTVLEAMSASVTPRVFTVYEVAPDRDDARVYAWGLDFGRDEAWFRTVDGAASGTVSSPEGLLERLSTVGEFRLVRVNVESRAGGAVGSR